MVVTARTTVVFMSELIGRRYACIAGNERLIQSNMRPKTFPRKMNTKNHPTSGRNFLAILFSERAFFRNSSSFVIISSPNARIRGNISVRMAV